MIRRACIASSLAAALAISCSEGDGGGSAGQTSTIGPMTGDSGSMTSSATTTSGDPTGASTSTSSTTDGETGIPPGCGDGVMTDDEQCDDGNDIDGDGCNVDCRPSGRLLWSHIQAAGVGLNEEAFDVGVTPSGEYYAVGYFHNAAMTQDVWARRFSAIGGVVSTTIYDGPAASTDQGRGVLIEPSTGDYFVVGYETVAVEGANILVQRRSADGVVAWQDSFNGAASSSDVGFDLAMDLDGDIIATGYEIDAVQSHDIWLRKYSPDGQTLWTRTHSGPSAGTDVGWALAIGPGNVIYAAGYENRAGEESNMWLGKFDTDGNLLWQRSVNGSDNLSDFLIGVAVDGNGNPIACGYHNAVGIPWRSFVRSYTPDGDINWTESYEGQSAEGAHCFGVTVDSAGRVVWTGGEIADGRRRIVVRKLDGDGNPLWTTLVPGDPTVGDDYGRELTLGAGDEIYVGGGVTRPADGLDVWVGRFAP